MTWRTRIIILVALGYVVTFAYNPAKEFWESRPRPTPKPIWQQKQTPKPVYRKPTAEPAYREPYVPEKPTPYIRITSPSPNYVARRGRSLVITWDTNVNNEYFIVFAGGKRDYETRISWIRIGVAPSFQRNYVWPVPSYFSYDVVNIFVGLENPKMKDDWIASDRVFIYVQ